MEADWRLLPPELLQVISEKLISIYDFVRFRAVCPAWRSASRPRPRHLPPQLPWLILPPSTTDWRDPNLASSLSLYDLSQSKTHTFHLPQIHGKDIRGCSHGWLVLMKEREVWLLNPFTRDQISLPSLSVQPKFSNGGNVKNDNFHSFPLSIKKAILSSNPSLDPDCFVMALLWGLWEIAFCRIGDDRWTILSGGEEVVPPRCDVSDIVYHNHFLYAIYRNSEARRWDVRKHLCKIIASGNDDQEELDFICIVEETCGEHGLMIFCQDYIHQAGPDPVYMAGIRMLSDEQEIWLNMEKELTSSYCFFFGGSSHCISLSLSNMQVDGWEENRICYTCPEFEKMIDNVDWYSCSIKLYKSDDRNVTTLASHLGCFQWFDYQFHSDTAGFLWITPTLC